ncbi:AarF/ABC1/UbiB kinase family protein [bacterium]|nr:AarF/ABC1/UbiB kinase family protein [bacterium]
MLSVKNLNIFGRAYRQFNRYRHIFFVLFKYGFGDVIHMLKLDHYLEAGIHVFFRKPTRRVKKMSRAKRIRMAFEELGPTYIKLGQLLSTRSDLLPGEYHDELLKLQDQIPPASFDTIIKTFQTEFGKPPEELFLHFEEKPLAGASIGQVHKAQLKGGEIVAVKIQRPDIRKIIKTDLEIIQRLASFLERNVKEFELHRPTRIVKEFANSLAKEIDYLIEAAHIERFARQFKNDQTIYVPKVYRELTCEHVITMEFIDGIKISEKALLEQKGYDLKVIVKRAADLIMKQIFVEGFFHGDPHHGNVFILPENTICYLDFGMMGRVNQEERENFTNLTLQIFSGDVKNATVSLLKHTTYDKKPDKIQFGKDLSVLIDQHLYRPLKELNIAKMLQQLIGILSKHGLCFKPDLFLMIKALSTAEILGKELDPDFDLPEHMRPFIKRVQQSMNNPVRIATDFIHSGSEYVHLLKSLPGELQEILNQAKEGKFKIEFEHHGLTPMLATHDKVSNRIVFAIVLAALIIGSSLIVLSGVPPKWHNIPIIGLSGFVIAGIMGFWLLWSILRHGKM